MFFANHPDFSFQGAKCTLALTGFEGILGYRTDDQFEGYKTEREKVKTNNYAAIESTVAYIKENLTADLSLEALADRAGFSSIYFHKCFRASVGMTIREYVEAQRIKRATMLLVQSNMTLTEIAYECGFSSQSYFSFAFRRKMGMTPREYSARLLEMYESDEQ